MIVAKYGKYHLIIHALYSVKIINTNPKTSGETSESEAVSYVWMIAWFGHRQSVRQGVGKLLEKEVLLSFISRVQYYHSYPEYRKSPQLCILLDSLQTCFHPRTFYILYSPNRAKLNNICTHAVLFCLTVVCQLQDNNKVMYGVPCFEKRHPTNNRRNSTRWQGGSQCIMIPPCC